MKRGPVGYVKDEKDDGEGDQHGHVQFAGLVLLQRRGQLAEGLHLHLQQDDGVLEQRPEDEEDAADDPRLHRVQAVRFRGVRRRRVENVHLQSERKKEKKLTICKKCQISKRKFRVRKK